MQALFQALPLNSWVLAGEEFMKCCLQARRVKPIGTIGRRCAVSPTFATGKLNEPDVPKISKMGIQDSSTSKSKKNRRTWAWPDRGCCRKERCRRALCVGAYNVGKYNGGVSLLIFSRSLEQLKGGRCGSTRDTIHLQGVPHRRGRPTPWYRRRTMRGATATADIRGP